jgi:DNA polymerase-3 subunit gamma/tau
VLSLPTAPLARRLGEERNIEMIKRALHTVLGVDWQVRCEHTAGNANLAAGAQPQQRPTQRPAGRRPEATQPPPADRVPPPPEPKDVGEPDPPGPPDDEAMDSAYVDPEQVALELLAQQLGARRIDS